MIRGMATMVGTPVAGALVGEGGGNVCRLEAVRPAPAAATDVVMVVVLR